MLATDKQIDYLEALQKKVFKIQEDRPDILRQYIPKRNWREERRRGMTTKDASARIEAYHRIISGANACCVLLGFRQF